MASIYLILKIMPVFCSETMYTVKVTLLTLHCLTCVMYMYRFFLKQTTITVSVLTCSLLLLFLSPTLKIKTLLFYCLFDILSNLRYELVVQGQITYNG